MPTTLRRHLVLLIAALALMATPACARVLPSGNPAGEQAAPVPSDVRTPVAVDETPDAVESSAVPSSTGPAPAVTPSATPTPTATPSRPVALLTYGSKGDDVRALQHRLLQLDWFSGSITPTYGPTTQLSVSGFQGKRGLPVTGEVDQATLDVLVKMTRTPTHDEMYNVLHPGPTLFTTGATGARVKDLQARLKQLSWFFGDVTGTYGSATTQAVKGFQAKREIPVTGAVDQRTLDRLRGMTHTPTTDELNNIVREATNDLDPRCMTGRAICISKVTNKLKWVVDGKVLLTMSVRFGSEANQTREGLFAVEWKDRDHVSNLYGSKMPFSMFFSGGQAVHYSSDFAARGYLGASHGCVNVRDWDGLEWLFGQARVGDRVVVHR